MKTEIKKVYYCEHCNKHMLSKGSMSRHERFCDQNPNNWHKCFKYCDHLIKTKELVPASEPEESYYKTIFTCDALHKKIYSFKLEKKAPHLIEADMERMPLKCESYIHEDDYDKPYL